MKAVVLAAALALATGHAAACDDTLFTVEDWTLGERLSETSRSVEITVSARYNGDQPVRMVDAYFVVRDPLGGEITRSMMPRDIRLEPGEEFTFDQYVSDSRDRLPLMDPEDVIFETCTTGLVYGDGTVDKIGAPRSGGNDPLFNILRNIEALNPGGSPASP